MTFSILTLDRTTGQMGGAATTGSLCVGGWVLRGDPRAGLSASQGAAPSTFWGEDAVAAMRAGEGAKEAVAKVTEPDPGRDARQLSALDRLGGTGAFTGRDNTPEKGSRAAPDVIVSGNLLTSETVLDAILDGYRAAEGPLAERLFAALEAGEAEGGDSRGLKSAALLIVGPDVPPLTLRVDADEAPLAALRRLFAETKRADYQAWLRTVPVLSSPHRRPG